jgi:hypothetical protein
MGFPVDFVLVLLLVLEIRQNRGRGRIGKGLLQPFDQSLTPNLGVAVVDSAISHFHSWLLPPPG